MEKFKYKFIGGFMKKKLLSVGLLSLLCFSILGCNSKEERIIEDEAYIRNNNGRFCDEYAITSILPNENANADIITLYEKLGNNQYVELFETKEFNFSGYLLTTDENIYFVYDMNGLKISAYPLKNNKDNVQSFNTYDMANFGVYYIKKVYGIKDNYIYFSYVKWDNRWTNIISYGKISLDLKEFVELNSENDIPTIYYKGC